MEGVPNSFGGWVWWFLTAIGIAFVVNLGSDYLKPRLDQYLEGYSTSRKISNEKKRQQLEQKVTTILNDPTEVNILLHNINLYTVLGIGTVILAAIFLVFAFTTMILGIALIQPSTWELGVVPPPGAKAIAKLMQSHFVFMLGLVTFLLILSLTELRSLRENKLVLRTYKRAKRKQATENSAPTDSTNSLVEAEKTTDHSPPQPGQVEDASTRIK